MSVNRLLFADSAGPKWQRAYGLSSYGLASFLPAGLVSPEGGILAKVSDIGLAVAIPVHTHIGMNYVVSDYVPRRLQVPVRAGVLGLSAVTGLGLMKLALTGPGVSGVLKELWRKQK